MKPQLAARPSVDRPTTPRRTPTMRAPRKRRRASLGARLLAAVALIAGLAAVVAVIETGGRSSSPPRASVVSHHRIAHLPAFWTVRHGDTLTGIAAKTGLTLHQLKVRNPGLNPSAL